MPQKRRCRIGRTSGRIQRVRFRELPGAPGAVPGRGTLIRSCSYYVNLPAHGTGPSFSLQTVCTLSDLPGPAHRGFNSQGLNPEQALAGAVDHTVRQKLLENRMTSVYSSRRPANIRNDRTILALSGRCAKLLAGPGILGPGPMPAMHVATTLRSPRRMSRNRTGRTMGSTGCRPR
jgi:hypothetical protein